VVVAVAPVCGRTGAFDAFFGGHAQTFEVFVAPSVTLIKQAVGRRPPRYAPAPPWAPKRLLPLSRRQRSSSFPRLTRSHAHRCSCLMRLHGGEQSGLVTLTSDLESGVRVTCGMSYLCANFGLPRPLCSRLRPDVCDRQDRQTSDRQTSDKCIA